MIFKNFQVFSTRFSRRKRRKPPLNQRFRNSLHFIFAALFHSAFCANRGEYLFLNSVNVPLSSSSHILSISEL